MYMFNVKTRRLMWNQKKLKLENVKTNNEGNVKNCLIFTPPDQSYSFKTHHKEIEEGENWAKTKEGKRKIEEHKKMSYEELDNLSIEDQDPRSVAQQRIMNQTVNERPCNNSKDKNGNECKFYLLHNPNSDYKINYKFRCLPKINNEKNYPKSKYNKIEDDFKNNKLLRLFHKAANKITSGNYKICNTKLLQRGSLPHSAIDSCKNTTGGAKTKRKTKRRKTKRRKTKRRKTKKI